MEKKKKGLVGLGEKLGFMSFSASTNIVFNFKSTYYKFFLTSILLIDPIAASNMAVIGTIWDVVNDPLLAVWANPNGSFICLEPWYGRTDDAGFTGSLEEKPGMQQLLPGEKKKITYSIEFHS